MAVTVKNSILEDVMSCSLIVCQDRLKCTLLVMCHHIVMALSTFGMCCILVKNPLLEQSENVL